MIKYLKKEIKHLPSIIVSFILLYGIVTQADYILEATEVSHSSSVATLSSSDVQGAIGEIYNRATDYTSMASRVTDVEGDIGNTALNTTAQTVTGAINELNTTATTSVYGMTKLSSALDSTSQVLAATPYAVKQVKDLVDTYNTNISTLKFGLAGTFTRSTSMTFTVPSNSRHLLLLNCASANCKGVYILYVNGSGTIYLNTIYQGSDLTVTKTTNSMTFTGGHASATTNIHVYDFILGGGILTVAS